MREEKDKRRRAALTGLIILVLAFIWGNSLLSPEASWAVSEAVKASIRMASFKSSIGYLLGCSKYIYNWQGIIPL